MEKVPPCPAGKEAEEGECTAFEDNPLEYAQQEICPSCLRKTYQPNGLLHLLLRKMHRIDMQCPVERDELSEEQWEALYALRNYRTQLANKEAEEAAKNKVKD